MKSLYIGTNHSLVFSVKYTLADALIKYHFTETKYPGDESKVISLLHISIMDDKDWEEAIIILRDCTEYESRYAKAIPDKTKKITPAIALCVGVLCGLLISFLLFVETKVKHVPLLYPPVTVQGLP
jgi:hypothetical protein